VADLLMVHVLCRLAGSGLLDEYPNLAAYIARAEAAPPSSVLSTLNWRFSPPRRPADKGPFWVDAVEKVLVIIDES
jgi:glutathione S-transferase